MRIKGALHCRFQTMCVRTPYGGMFVTKTAGYRPMLVLMRHSWSTGMQHGLLTLEHIVLSGYKGVKLFTAFTVSSVCTVELASVPSDSSTLTNMINHQAILDTVI